MLKMVIDDCLSSSGERKETRVITRSFDFLDFIEITLCFFKSEFDAS